MIVWYLVAMAPGTIWIIHHLMTHKKLRDKIGFAISIILFLGGIVAIGIGFIWGLWHIIALMLKG